MSWIDKIHDAVREAEPTGNRKVGDDMIQAALSDMNGKLQAVTNTIDPEDYAFYFVALRLAGKAIGRSLGASSLLMAAMVETRTSQTIVTVPASLRPKENGNGNADH